MDLNYINPVFKNLGPSNINKSVKEVRKSSIYKGRTKIKQEYRDLLDNALKKIKQGDNLELYDYKVLLYNLNSLNNEECTDICIAFMDNLDNMEEKEQFIRPILNNIYNDSCYEQGIKYYPLLREISVRTKAKGKYKTIIRTIKRYDDLDNYLKYIEAKIIKAKDENILETIKSEYFIKSTDDFYISCIYSYIIKNICIEEHIDRHINIMNSMPYNKRIAILKIALEKCKGRYKHLKIKWIIHMGLLLNHPYEGANSNWNEFDKSYKDEYILYYNEKTLNQAFKEGQEDRNEFFIYYSSDIYNIAYFENFRKSLVMEFKNHTLISMGNSLYIYNKNIYNIHKLKEMLEVNKKSECIAMLKDESTLEANLHYKKQWQNIFTEELLIRGYKGEG